MEARLTRLEDLVEQLITSVGSVLEQQSEIRADIKNLQTGQAEMKKDITEMKQDIVGMKQDITGMKKDIQDLQTSVNKLNANQARFEHQQKEMLQKMDEHQQAFVEQSEIFRREHIITWEKLALHDKRIGRVETAVDI